MAWPADPLPVTVEMYLGSSDGWVDITDYVFVRNGGITIRRGFPDEGTTPEPSSMTMTLDNRDGRFTPRNPESPYYGLIGRNTPIRVSVGGVLPMRSYRFYGEVSEWPPRWDVSGQDVYVPITAQGILRRISQGRRPLMSPFKQGMLTPLFADLVEAYWPMEDGADATQFAPALGGGGPLTYSGTRPDFAAIGPVFGSDKLPVLAASTVIRGRVPQLFGFPQTIRFWFVIDVPPSPSWGDNTSLLRVDQDEGTDGIHAWEVQYFTSSGGALAVAYIGESTAAVTSDLITNINSIGQLWVSVSISQSVSDEVGTAVIGVSAYSLDDGGNVVTQGTSTTLGTGSNLVTTPRGFQIGRGGAPEMGIGHVAFSVVPLNIAFSATQRRYMLTAFASESAGARAERLVTDSGVPLTMIGDADDTELMGSQAIPAIFREAFNETWAADMAFLFETRDELGLTFRTRRSLYNQPIALTLDYEAAGEIAPDLEPIDDDQRTRNDITVKRKNGSSFRAVDSTSRMGTQDPPDGVGRYEGEVEVNLFSDSQLEGQAHWRLHLGTWDEPRFPRVTVNLTALKLAGKDDLVAAACGLDVGDRIRLTNLPPFAGTPGTVDLMVLGFQPEEIGHPTEWRMTFNCVPYGPYNTGKVGGPGRLQVPAGTAIAEDLTTTETDVTVSAAVFSSSAVPYDVEVGGERMTVTAVSGTTLTVTRSVNGVVKSHSSGDAIRIADPIRTVL